MSEGFREDTSVEGPCKRCGDAALKDMGSVIQCGACFSLVCLSPLELSLMGGRWSDDNGTPPTPVAT